MEGDYASSLCNGMTGLVTDTWVPREEDQVLREDCECGLGHVAFEATRVGITVGGWVFSLELRERPSPEATYGLRRDNSTTGNC